MDHKEKVKAAEIIKSGGIIAFRTDTFYGLGVDPFNASAVRKIFELKGREEGKPIPLLISDYHLVKQFLAETNENFAALSQRFWPGPLTLIGKARENLPQELTAGTGTLGLRLPSDDRVRVLVRACGGALTATSANPSGRPPARNAQEVAEYFDKKVDLIVDDGEVSATEPSTVVDVTTSEPRIVRQGALQQAELTKFFGGAGV